MTKSEFKSLFDNHFEAVRNYIWYRSGDMELASDITQEAFLKLRETQPEVKNGNLKGLVFKIAGDLFVSSYRRKKVALNFQMEQKHKKNQSETPEDKIAFYELKLQYEKALSMLPEKQRTVYLMHRNDKMKYYEIADSLGISTKAVEKRISKALGFLKQKLNYSETS